MGANFWYNLCELCFDTEYIKNIAIAWAAIAGYRDRSILSFLYHSINLAIYSMDKQKNVCYN